MKMSKYKTKRYLDFEPVEPKEGERSQLIKRRTKKSEQSSNISGVTIILIICIAISFSLNIYLGMRDCDNDAMQQLDQCSDSLTMSQEQLDTCSTNLQLSNQQVVECLLNCTLELGNE